MNKQNKEDRDFILKLAILQDSLLQNYRLIFLTSQSILIPLSAILILSEDYYSNQSNLWFLIPLFLLGLFIWWLWIRVTKSRGFDVSYCHMLLLQYDMKEYNDKYNDRMKAPFLEFKRWQQNKDKKPDWKEEVIRDFYKDHKDKSECNLLKSFTRKYVENILPFGFFFLWMALISLTINNYFQDINICCIIVIIFSIILIFHSTLTDLLKALKSEG